MKYIKRLIISDSKLIEFIKEIKIDYLEINYQKINLDEIIKIYDYYFKDKTTDQESIEKFTEGLYNYFYIHQKANMNVNILLYILREKDLQEIFNKKTVGKNLILVYKKFIHVSDNPLPKDLEEELYKMTLPVSSQIYEINLDVILEYISKIIKDRDFNFENNYLFNIYMHSYFINKYILNIVFDVSLKNKQVKSLKEINDEFEINDFKDKTNKIFFSKEDLYKIIEYEKKYMDSQLSYDEYDNFFKTNFKKSYDYYFKNDIESLHELIDEAY
jgi:hypothetical protein